MPTRQEVRGYARPTLEAAAKSCLFRHCEERVPERRGNLSFPRRRIKKLTPPQKRRPRWGETPSSRLDAKTTFFYPDRPLNRCRHANETPSLPTSTARVYARPTLSRLCFVGRANVPAPRLGPRLDPKGRRTIAQGVSPGYTARVFSTSPEGATPSYRAIAPPLQGYPVFSSPVPRAYALGDYASRRWRLEISAANTSAARTARQAAR